MKNKVWQTCAIYGQTTPWAPVRAKNEASCLSVQFYRLLSMEKYASLQRGIGMEILLIFSLCQVTSWECSQERLFFSQKYLMISAQATVCLWSQVSLSSKLIHLEIKTLFVAWFISICAKTKAQLTHCNAPVPQLIKTPIHSPPSKSYLVFLLFNFSCHKKREQSAGVNIELLTENGAKHH